MAIDPQIALGVRSPQINVDIPSPIQQFATVMSLRDMMTRQQMGQMQLQQAQLGLQQAQQQAKERQALADYYQSLQTPATPGTQPAGPGQGIDYAHLMTIAPNLAPGIIKSHSDALQAQAKAQHEQYSVQQDRLNRLSALGRGITDEQSKLAQI